MTHPPMDMVFTYVDGADPSHAAKRAAARQALMADGPPGGQPVLPERDVWYGSVGEIAYGARSVLKFMPWIRTIYIVTDEQQPPIDRELLASGRVRTVDHKDIIPAEFRPTFDSTIIESFLHRIPGLSEVYLYNNDDVMHGAPIAPEEFVEFTRGGAVTLRLRTTPGLVRAAIQTASDRTPDILPRANTYTAGIANACRLLRSRRQASWGQIVYPRHVTQVYRTETARRVEDVFGPELEAARGRRFRSHGQLSWSTLCYSLERRWHGALEHRRGLAVSPGSPDELFVDFARYARPRQRAAAWRRVARSTAKFICLNNLPWQERSAFEEAMASRGLSR